MEISSYLLAMGIQMYSEIFLTNILQKGNYRCMLAIFLADVANDASF
jgi:hypothetical protein